MAVVNYKDAGVNIDAGNQAVARIKKNVESTFGPRVLTSIGAFGAMFDLKELLSEYQHPVLVQSIDGVGTKMMVAKMMQKFDTIGIDLVSATVNDIIVLGAKPLTLLDYIANDVLNPDIIEQIICGMAQACREHNIALVGGETAEMPGTYLPGEHDLVGIVTGVLEKDKAVLGSGIRPGDKIFALPSSGLHTNGYSLARKLLFEVGKYQVTTYVDVLQTSVGDELLKPHLNYAKPILPLLNKIPIKGLAHITGGGLIDNVPRVLPKNCTAEIKLAACPKLAIFELLSELGKLEQDEAYRTFNMGIGMVIIVASEHAAMLKECVQQLSHLPLYNIGEVVPGNNEVRLI